MTLTKLLDIYIKRPLLYDIILVVFVIWLNDIICKKVGICINADKETLKSLLNELVSSSVSVGGFIIAALTIILTMRDSIGKKDIKESQSGSELLLLSRHYKRIVNAFFGACIIFVGTFFYFSMLEVYVNHLSKRMFLYLIIGGLSITILCILRCLIILHKIIELQIKK